MSSFFSGVLVLLLASSSFRFVHFFVSGFSSVPVLYHEPAPLPLETISIPDSRITPPPTTIREGKRRKQKKSQNVRPRKETECLTGVSQVCEADTTTDGICQRLGCFEASAISGINSPSRIGRDLQQHTCGPQWQVGLIHLGCFPSMQC